MAMKKGAKIGLGIFIGFVSVIVIIVAAAAILLFGGRDFKPGEYTAEEKEAVAQKLPAIEKLEQLKKEDSGKNVVYTDPKEDNVSLSQGEMNAIVSENNPVQDVLNGIVGSDEETSQPAIKIDGTSVKIEDDKLELQMKLGESNVTKNATVDDYLNGSVATGKFVTQNGKIKLTEFQLNNLGANMIPEFILNELPDYDGGSMVDYINAKYPDAIQDAFKDLFIAERIDSINIENNEIKVDGSFYQDAYVE